MQQIGAPRGRGHPAARPGLPVRAGGWPVANPDLRCLLVLIK